MQAPQAGAPDIVRHLLARRAIALGLATEAAPGTPLLDVLPLGDVRHEVDVLPNRPDLLSHRGLAREIAALLGA